MIGTTALVGAVETIGERNIFAGLVWGLEGGAKGLLSGSNRWLLLLVLGSRR